MPLERCALNPPHQIKSRSNISKSRSATFFSLNVVTHDKHRPITSVTVTAASACISAEQISIGCCHLINHRMCGM